MKSGASLIMCFIFGRVADWKLGCLCLSSYLRCDIIRYIHLRSTIENATYDILCELLLDAQLQKFINKKMLAMCTSGMFLVYISISSRALPL